MAERSVGAFESELTVRAGEDVQRLQRFAAAEQLRAQIEAVSGTLRRAEEDARAAVDAAGQVVAAAEADFDQAASVVSDLARQTRKLAEELPIDQRPEGDPLESLLELADTLRGHTEVLRPEIDRAEASVATASVTMEEALAERQLAGDGNEGPRAEDLLAGLESLLDEPSDDLLVLDEPFVGVDQSLRAELLEIVRTSSADRQVVLLTEDADVLGWAIELPIDEAAALPADALLNRMRASDTDHRAAAVPVRRLGGRRRHHHQPVPRPSNPNPNLRRRPAVGPVSAEHRRPPCSVPPTSGPSSPWPWPCRWPRSSRSLASRCSTRRPRWTRPRPRPSWRRRRSDQAASSSTCRTSATGPPST